MRVGTKKPLLNRGKKACRHVALSQKRNGEGRLRRAVKERRKKMHTDVRASAKSRVPMYGHR